MEETAASLLLVDDRVANLLALEAIVQPLGHRIVRAGSGEEALRWLLREEFALVLMDLMMPGLDGVGTVALMRQRDRTRHTPVIFITASVDAAQARRAYSQGAVDFLVKPYDPEVLRAKVSVFVALWSQGKRLEREQRAAAREHAAREAAESASRAKDAFLAMVSHELRTPLNAILGWGELLQSGTLEEARAKHAVEAIVRSARAQSQLIDDLLDLSRIVAGKFRLDPKPLQLDQVVRAAIETVRPIALGKRVDIRASLAAFGDELVGDPVRLQQVAWNILSNAVKFTPAGGTVWVTLARDGDAALLEVSDDGPGIPAELLPRVFDRFQQGPATGPRAGLGLGLAIVRHIVELHGGEVEARSPGPGQGATFAVRLPARASIVRGSPAGHAAHEPTPAARHDPARLDDVRVLVVDDDAEARALTATILVDAGAEVRTARSVLDALGVLENEAIDLVVADLDMPVEDGLLLRRRLRGLRRRVPAVAVSARAAPEDRARARAAGFVGHLSKPFRGAALVSLTARLVERR